MRVTIAGCVGNFEVFGHGEGVHTGRRCQPGGVRRFMGWVVRDGESGEANDPSHAQRKWLDYTSPDQYDRRLATFFTDVTMAPRLLHCAIEEVADWHANLYVEPHLVAFVAVAGQYSSSPARFDVKCGRIASRWLGKSAEFRLEVSWQDDTAEKAARLRETMQASPLVELASVVLCADTGKSSRPTWTTAGDRPRRLRGLSCEKTASGAGGQRNRKPWRTGAAAS